MFTSAKYVVLVACAMTALVAALQTGAPSRCCVDLVPDHVGIPPQETPAPFTVTVSWINGTQYNVKLDSVGVELRGFLMNAQRPGDNTPVGLFTSIPSDVAQARPCPSDTDPNNGVTHIDNNVKNETISFVWDSQGADVSNVLLYCTFVQRLQIFWVKVPSNAIPVPPFRGNV